MAQAVIKNAARHHFMDFCSTLGRLSSSSKPIKNAPKCIILNIEFQNFLGGDTPEPPLREGTLTPGHPLWQFLATPLIAGGVDLQRLVGGGGLDATGNRYHGNVHALLRLSDTKLGASQCLF